MSTPTLQQAVADLRTSQSLFVKCLGELIRYAGEQGYELTLGEGYVKTPRKTRDGYTVNDGEHMPSSLHYSGLACDLNLFVQGVWKSADCPEWHNLGEFWLALDPSCMWGGQFTSLDLNHFSIRYGGKA